MTDFAGLHVPGDPLVLANAWDAASAAIVASVGADAVATTSGGVAWSLGRADGNQVTADEMVALAERILRVVDVPVSVDLESGCSTDPDEVARLAARIAGTGAAGINLEDTWDGAFLSPDAQAERIRAIRAAAPRLFVNARIDAFLFGVDDAETKTVQRAVAVVEAGAQGVFVPGLVDLETLERLVAAIDAPLAVLATRGGPTVEDFASVGVARVSVGTDLAESAYRQLRDEASALFGTGRFDATGLPFGYGELNELFR